MQLTANFICPWDRPHGIDESTDDRLRQALSVLDQPRAQSGHDVHSAFHLVNDPCLLFLFQGRFDALKELNIQGIAFVDIGDVAIETCFGKLIG